MLMDCQLYASSISTFLHSSKFMSNLSSKPFLAQTWSETLHLIFFINFAFES